jgi:hypothetical protein
VRFLILDKVGWSSPSSAGSKVTRKDQGEDLDDDDDDDEDGRRNGISLVAADGPKLSRYMNSAGLKSIGPATSNSTTPLSNGK